VAHATSRMHFYDSGMWVNVLKGRYDAFFPSSAIVGPKFESRNLILLTRDWTTRDLIRGQGENPRSLDLSYNNENDFR